MAARKLHARAKHPGTEHRLASQAPLAPAARGLHPGDADAVADLACRHARADGQDLADGLVTERPREGAGDFAARLVDVGVAHAAGADLDEDLVWPGLGRRHVLEHPGAVDRWDDGGFHFNPPIVGRLTDGLAPVTITN
jgi:hypothetical protein